MAQTRLMHVLISVAVYSDYYDMPKMAYTLEPVGPHEHLPTPLSSLPPTPLVSTDLYPAAQTLEATANDIRAPAAAETPDSAQHVEDHARRSIPKAVTWRLYISHFFSTWNSRSFEFGAVLFLASIFPMTLLPLSIYALVRSSSAICFAPLIGRTIDRKRRLPVVRFSIGKLFSFHIEQTFRRLCRRNIDFLVWVGEQLSAELR